VKNIRLVNDERVPMLGASERGTQPRRRAPPGAPPLVRPDPTEEIMRIVVNTPNGNIGRSLTLELLERGAKVVGIARSPGKLGGLVERGLEVVEGSTDDPAVLARALSGADALFWLTPPAFRPDFREWTRAAARAGAEAAKAQGVKRVVVLSSLGAQSGPGSGPVGVLLDIEETFKAAAPDVTVLRPGYFMENLLRNVPTIAQAGSIFSPVPADKRFPMVATADIAAKGVEVLLDPQWKGHRVVGVHGPADLTYREVAGVLAEALGKPVSYVEVSLDQARQGMLGAGMPDFVADMFVEMYGAILDGRMDAAEPRSAETTTPTPLRAFARETIRPAVEQASAS
jgi:uncharacterized protein YbjT (DUF2867 family)